MWIRCYLPNVRYIFRNFFYPAFNCCLFCGRWVRVFSPVLHTFFIQRCVSCYLYISQSWGFLAWRQTAVENTTVHTIPLVFLCLHQFHARPFAISWNAKLPHYPIESLWTAENSLSTLNQHNAIHSNEPGQCSSCHSLCICEYSEANIQTKDNNLWSERRILRSSSILHFCIYLGGIFPNYLPKFVQKNYMKMEIPVSCSLETDQSIVQCEETLLRLNQIELIEQCIMSFHFSSPKHLDVHA